MRGRPALPVVIACALALCLAGCASGAGEAPEETMSATSMTSADEAFETVDAAYLKSGARFTLVDVRTQEEYEKGHIPGAMLNSWDTIPTPCNAGSMGEQMAAGFAGTKVRKDTPLVLYCKTGVRAAKAATALMSAGYTDVAVYEGSWRDWSSDPSNPVQKGKKRGSIDALSK